MAWLLQRLFKILYNWQNPQDDGKICHTLHIQIIKTAHNNVESAIIILKKLPIID